MWRRACQPAACGLESPRHMPLGVSTFSAAVGGTRSIAPGFSRNGVNLSTPHPPSAPSPLEEGRRTLDCKLLLCKHFRAERPSPRGSGERVAEGRVRGALALS